MSILYVSQYMLYVSIIAQFIATFIGLFYAPFSRGSGCGIAMDHCILLVEDNIDDLPILSVQNNLAK